MSRIGHLGAFLVLVVLQLYTFNGASAKGPAFPDKVLKTASHPSCGNLVRTVRRSTRANLVSPGYNSGGYENNMHCEWILKAQGNKKLRLKFNKLKLKYDEGCNDDYVAIYDDISGVLTAKFCGSRCKGDVTLPSKRARVVFHTNANKRNRGFKLKYWRVSNSANERISCGCDGGTDDGCVKCGEKLTQPTGVMTSSLYPETYPNNEDCLWTIQVAVGKDLHFRALFVDIEYNEACGYDALTLASYNSDLQMILCGDHCLPEIVLSHHKAVVRFTSDYSVRGFGFELDYASVVAGSTELQDDLLMCHCPQGAGCSGPNVEYAEGNLYEDIDCGGIFTDTSGDLFSPSWPSQYPNHARCVYSIDIPGIAGVELTFEHFQIEDESMCNWDALHISSDSGYSTVLCGSQYGTISVRGENITLVFSTDYSVVDSGFHISYDVIDGDGSGDGDDFSNIDCNHTLSGPSGNFSSHGYPSNYGNNMLCVYEITVEEGLNVRLQMLDFEVEESEGCIYDRLSVHQGNGARYFYCGQYFPQVLTSSDNTLTLMFETDHSVVFRGFSFEYTAVNVSGSSGPDGPVECGMIPGGSLSGFIVGGSEADPHSYPWMIVLEEYGGFICGGSVVAQEWVVTAAHCLDASTPTAYSILAGAHSLTSMEPTQQRKQVAEVIMHEGYNAWTNENDIALLRLSSPLDWTSEVRPICIPSDSDAVGTSCVISGWGNTETYGFPNTLQSAVVPLLDNDDCDEAVGSIYDSMVCAGYMAGGIDTCQGDSGGPLACANSAGKYTLQGVTSWGIGCADPGFPGVYARVSEFTNWIDTNTGGAVTGI